MQCNINPTLIDPTRRPMIADLQIRFPSMLTPGSYAQGTGTLIHPRTILTVGHNIFDPTLGGKATQIDVRLGGENREHFVCHQYDTTDQWKTTDAYSSRRYLSGFDIGVVFLPQPSAVPTDQLLPAARADDELQNVQMWQDGYQGIISKPFYEASGQILQVKKRRLFYPIRTLGGQSGGPAYVSNGSDSAAQIVGVHASIVHEPQFNACGSAVRLTPDILKLLNDWIDGPGNESEH